MNQRAHGACRMCVCFRFHAADAHTHDANAGALTLCARARAINQSTAQARPVCAINVDANYLDGACERARRRPMHAGLRPVALCVVVDSQKLRPRETRFGAPAHTRRRACLLASCSACLYISVRFRFHWHNASARVFDIWMEFAYNEFNHFA